METGNTPTPSDAAEELPRCKCGTDRHSKYCVVNRDYSFTGVLYLLWGGTSVPSRVTFRCVKCGAFFETTTAPSICKQYTT